MSEVKVFESVLSEILRKSIEMMSSWLWINAMFIVVIQSFHEHLRNILIINREDETGTSLVYFLSEVLLHQQIIDIFCIPCECLIDPIHSMVSEVDDLIEYFSLPISMEVLVIKVRDVELSRIEHAFLRHPVTSIAKEVEIIVARDCLKALHELATDEVGFQGVRQDAYGLIKMGELPLRCFLQHIYQLNNY